MIWEICIHIVASSICSQVTILWLFRAGFEPTRRGWSDDLLFQWVLGCQYFFIAFNVVSAGRGWVALDLFPFLLIAFCPSSCSISPWLTCGSESTGTFKVWKMTASLISTWVDQAGAWTEAFGALRSRALALSSRYRPRTQCESRHRSLDVGGRGARRLDRYAYARSFRSWSTLGLLVD